jgi:hypothetical protein
MAFFGTGGNIAEMDTDLALPKVRVRCAVPETGPDSNSQMTTTTTTQAPTQASTPAPTQAPTQAPTKAPEVQSSSSPKPQTFILGKKGVDKCPSGYEPITSTNECKAASKKLNKKFDKKESKKAKAGVCILCGGCKPKAMFLSDKHGAKAQWVCKSTPQALFLQDATQAPAAEAGSGGVETDALGVDSKNTSQGQTVECTFKVVVMDPFRPYVDGRRFRCGASAASGAVEPFGVCGGTELDVHFHDGYETTGGYDVQGTLAASADCCSDEHGVAYTCGGNYSTFQYCTPATAPPSLVAQASGMDSAKDLGEARPDFEMYRKTPVASDVV